MEVTGNILNNRYKLLESIASGRLSNVYRAVDLEINKDVAVKIYKKTAGAFHIEDKIRFNLEGTALAEINHPNVIKIFEIGESDDQHLPRTSYLVMEYLTGKNLQDILKARKTLPLAISVNIIIEICKALEAVHSHGLTHKNINPGNIFLSDITDNDDLGFLKLIDFNLSRLIIPVENNDKKVNETLYYISPEQGGILKKGIDERSDLYSLGIIFYELLTGAPPYRSDKIGKILHEHIAKIPELPRKINPDIPEILEKIILKLINKDPEKRYQSSYGLLSDLNSYSSGEEILVVGMDDTGIRLSYRTDLIGRKTELQCLKKNYDRAMNGEKNLCLISGEAGSGKTRLVEELKEQITSIDLYLIHVKCFQGENKTPFGPFVEILKFFIRSFNLFPRKNRERISFCIKKRIGALSRLLVHLNPEIENIIDYTDDVVNLEPYRENIRFLVVVSHFFQIIAECLNGMVLVIEDLQWADKESIKLINRISEDIAHVPLFIIGTYRNEEVAPGEDLESFIGSAVENRNTVTEINCNPFDATSMREFIAGLLHEDEENVSELTSFILPRSGGNPFYSVEVLKHLVNEKALKSINGRWQIDRSILYNIEIPDTIIDIILKKISLLTENEKKLLTAAATIGKEFNIELLIRLMGSGIESDIKPFIKREENSEIVLMIDRAISYQLVHKLQDEGASLNFTHDRIRDAFYQSAEKNELKELHLKIAKYLEEVYTKDKGTIFDLAYHYIRSGKEEKIIKYAIVGARKAESNFANYEAYKLYSVIHDTLEENFDMTEDKYKQLWLESMEGMGNSSLITGNNDRAVDIYKRILPFKSDEIEIADIYKQLCSAYFKKGDWINCEEYGRKGLAFLGEKLPVKNMSVIYGIIKEFFIHLLPLFKPKLIHDPESIKFQKNRMKVWYYTTLNWMYALDNLTKFTRSIIKMFNISKRKIGLSVELGMCFGAYASLCMAVPLFRRAIKYHERGLKIREELKDEWGVAQSLQWLGYNYQWMGDYNRSNSCFIDSLKRFKNIGDIWELGIVIHGIDLNYINLGKYDLAMEYLEKFIDLSTESNDVAGICGAYNDIMNIYIETGDYSRAKEWREKYLSLPGSKNLPFHRCYNNIQFGILQILLGNYDEALELLRGAIHSHETNNFIRHYIVNAYTHLAEVSLMKCKTEGKSSKDYYKNLRTAGKLCRNAIRKTKRWKTHYGDALRVSALYNAMLGKYKMADTLFNRSIDLQKSIFRVQKIALSMYDYGIFLLETKEPEKGEMCLLNSYRIFSEINSIEYMKKIREIINIDELYFRTVSREHGVSDKKKFEAVMNLSIELRSIRDRSEFINHLMAKAVELTGAQRGLIFIKNRMEHVELVAGKKVNIGDSSDYPNSIILNTIRNSVPFITSDSIDNNEIIEADILRDYKSVLCVPIVHYDRVLGACYLDNRLSHGVFSSEDLNLISILMNQVATSIVNMKTGPENERNIFPDEYFDISGEPIAITDKFAGDIAENKYFLFSQEGARIVLNYDDIIYFSSHGRHTIIHTEDKDFETPLSISKIENRLSGELFIRIHKQYIVNIKYISQVKHMKWGQYMIYLNDSDDTVLNIGRTFFPLLKEKLQLKKQIL